MHAPPSSISLSRKAALTLLVLIGVSLFAVSVVRRHPWFGELAVGGHQWLTGSTIKFSQHWYEEGPGTLRFLMLENPRSIEFQTLEAREPYISYPPGTIVPIWLLSLLLNREPDAALVMAWNLAGHLLIGLLLSLLLFRIVTRLGAALTTGLALSLFPQLIVFFTPGPLYFLQNVYFSDQAVLLPIAVLLLLETFASSDSLKARRIDLAISLVGFWGVFTDWVFVFFWTGLLAKRFFAQEGTSWIRRLWRLSLLSLGPAISLVLFSIQILTLGALAQLKDKFLFRTAVTAHGKEFASDFFTKFWMGSFRESFGGAGLVHLALIYAALLFGIACRARAARRQEGAFAGAVPLALLMGLAPLCQIYVFKNHSAIHSFSALKFMFVLACGLPLALLSIPRVRDWTLKPAGAGALLGLAVTHVGPLSPSALAAFPPKEPGYSQLRQVVRANTTFRDVVFSPNVDIPANPPGRLAYTKKRSYLVGSPAEIGTRLQSLPEGAAPALLIEGEPAGAWSELVLGVPLVAHEGPFRLYRVPAARLQGSDVPKGTGQDARTAGP